MPDTGRARRAADHADEARFVLVSDRKLLCYLTAEVTNQPCQRPPTLGPLRLPSVCHSVYENPRFYPEPLRANPKMENG